MNKNKLRQILNKFDVLYKDEAGFAIAAALLAISDSIDGLTDSIKEEIDESGQHIGVKLSEIKEAVDFVGEAVNNLDIPQ